MIRVDRRQLGPLLRLADGGVATVYRVGGTLPSLPANLVFKELLPHVAGAARRDMLAAMRNAVALRESMSPGHLAELDAVTAWPLAMVEEDGVEVGVLLRLLDDDFFVDTRPPGGMPRRQLFEFQYLSAASDYVARLGFDRRRADDGLVRLALMARLAYAIEIIHRPWGRHHIVYGDLSLRNAAVATDPPRVVLMDCDGVADVNDLSRVQLNTPFFLPPELANHQQKAQDHSTDVFKLGLCVIRGLAVGRGATQLTDPASPLVIPGLLDHVGVDLLKHAISADRANRPTAKVIRDYLVERVLALIRPPELLSASVHPLIDERGADTLVKWVHRHGRKIRILGAGGLDTREIDADGHPDGYPLRLRNRGPVFVELSNEHGVVTSRAQYLDHSGV